jgi:ribonucleoside-diphosphate reductase alpha chain
MSVKTRKVDTIIKAIDGSIVFEKKNFEVPETWSDAAATIAASKYATKEENSVLDIINRVVQKITIWGMDYKYFSTDEAHDFSVKLFDILVNQRAAFNTPAWINLGIEGVPQVSAACYIGNAEDTLEDILKYMHTAGMIFRAGSGIGVNISKLRGSGEPLSKRGTSSGPLSFMKAWDASAGAVKSGGRSRRSASLIAMDVNHPDIETFVSCKASEEDKARLLMAAGLSANEASQSISFQNANHSVSITDEFMTAVKKNKQWKLRGRVDGSVVKKIKARDLFHKIAEAAWKSGDPGLQFRDTINAANPIPNTSDIECSNPCQPGWATVLTPEGIRTFDDIDIGSTIWSGQRWTRVINKVFTGTKPVSEYITTAGSFIGTEKHRIFENGERVEVKDAKAIDISTGPQTRTNNICLEALVDGWVLGDGSVHKASNDLVYLLLGKEDVDVFTKNYNSFYVRHRPGLSDDAHIVRTSITAEELPKTYEREIPNRFLTGTKEEVCSFLKGLYNANGSICGGRITLKAASFKVICGVQQMLSSIGIRSYFTTNKKHDVKFSNGVYECKESYDLNITTDRHLFASLVGFDHPSKKERLPEALEIKSTTRPPKKTFEIIKTIELGEHPVWDITVEADEHSYWTGGLLVSNCGEVYAINYTSCLLAAINILKYINRIDKGQYILDTVALEKDVEILTTALDIMIEGSDYPDPRFEKVAKETRPIGIGVSNLAAALMVSGIKYDSEEGRDMAKFIYKNISSFAANTSIKLSTLKGPFKEFPSNVKETIEAITNVCLPLDQSRIAKLIKKYGIRNSQLTTAMPCGTVGLWMDCDSFGIEPIFAKESRKTLVGGGEMVIVPKCIEIARQEGYSEDVICDSSMHWADHVKMVAALQEGISMGVSKTINMSDSATVEDIEEAYMMAWEEGLKGITIYRNGSKVWQPMSSTNEEKIEQEKVSLERKRLPNDRDSKTHHFDIGGFEGYLTSSTYPDTNKLGEIFIRASKLGTTTQGILDSFAVMVSIALQYGVPLEKLVEKFVGTTFEPSGITQNPDIRFCSSVMDYLFKYLKQNHLDDKAIIEATTENKVIKSATKTFDGPPCPTCGQITHRSGACYMCNSCGLAGGCST